MGFNLPVVCVVGGTDVFRSWNSLNCILFVLRYGFSGWSLDVLVSIGSCFIDGMVTDIDSLIHFKNSAMIIIDENIFWDISSIIYYCSNFKRLKHPLIRKIAWGSYVTLIIVNEGFDKYWSSLFTQINFSHFACDYIISN